MIIDFIFVAVAGFVAGFFLFRLLRGSLHKRGLENAIRKIKNQERQDFIIDGEKYNLVKEIQKDLVKTIEESQMAQQIIPVEEPVETTGEEEWLAERIAEPIEAPIKQMDFPPLPKPPKLPEPPKKKKKVKINVSDLLKAKRPRK